MWHGPAVTTMASTSSSTHGMPGPREDHMGSSSAEHKPMPIAPQMGVPGIVASLGTSSFAMTLPGNKEHATTTFTVNVTASTTYQHASSTATFADVTVGAKVVVLGKVASSTKTIMAQRVVITGAGMKPEKKEGLINKLKHFFFGKFGPHKDDAGEHTASSTPAAAVESSGIGSLLKALFGWL